MQKNKRLLILLLCAFFVLFAMFAFSFVAAEIHHDCEGFNCRICAEIQLCENFIRTLAALVAAVCAAVVVAKLGKKRISEFLFNLKLNLITLKVKLSD